MDLTKEENLDIIEQCAPYNILNELRFLFISMRPKQWSKNLFLFSGILFSGKMSDVGLFIQTIEAFSLFCLASSTVYLLNDVFDFQKDQFHPTKALRPIASRALAIPHAVVYAIIGLGISLSLSFLLNSIFGWILVLYIVQNIFYSWVLKTVVILDILMISFGFALRVLSGSIIANVLPSEWVILTTIFLALLLGFGKRRGEILLLNEEASKHRSNLSQYTLQYLDYLTFSMANLCIISYLLFVLTSGHHTTFILTIPFTLYAILRYLYLLFVDKRTEGPEILALDDKPLLVSIALWVIACIAALYIL